MKKKIIKTAKELMATKIPTLITPAPLPRNSKLFTDRSGWFRINPLDYSQTEPVDPTDWQFFPNIGAAQQALGFNLLDLVPFIDTSGFYNPVMKIRAGLFVYGPDNLILLQDNKDTYAYPVGGWTWYASAGAASIDSGVPIQDFNLDLI